MQLFISSSKPGDMVLRSLFYFDGIAIAYSIEGEAFSGIAIAVFFYIF
ncbi:MULTISPECIES: hypothetical protein [Nostoc]|uniref:Uncharacterized protein n=2 Tax=Nostoc TaxID=1177 RepID=A0ABR8ICL3_9NOSO|nr:MULTISPECIES: hypothetical protein [Nostoc]MBD2563200.1 hypothetical protein [Nostoc linckia FACHB-391]MBD2648868.1 hypothetical protein [Nostoc foliaceum FACHB-393]